MSGFAYDRAPDSTLSLLREGYEFIPRRCSRLGADAFETRLLGQRTVCCRGSDAARLFYDTSRMQRQGAMPSFVMKTLVGEGGVQSLDGEQHRARKKMFMALMTPERLAVLADDLERQWRYEISHWSSGRPIVFLDRSRAVLARAACRWGGVPLTDDSAPQRAADLAAMIDGGGSLGPRHWRARWARARSERWLSRLVRMVRAGDLTPPSAAALAVIAAHRDPEGQALPERVAAVELLNVLRPTVAISTFLAFAMLALHRFPEVADRAGAWTDRELTAFVHEVRRCYPFFPFAAARACKAFTWRGYRFPAGRRVLLDLYGTNRDPALWDEPESFRPERFVAREPDPYAFIPQGGGDHFAHHRCAGEWLTVALMKRSLALLLAELRWDVPSQDLSVSLRRMPARPASGFILARRG